MSGFYSNTVLHPFHKTRRTEKYGFTTKTSLGSGIFAYNWFLSSEVGTKAYLWACRDYIRDQINGLIRSDPTTMV